MSFWKQLTTPIIGLAPMDGVTDAAFRYVADKYGHPHILMTEFTSVEGLDRGVSKLLEAFMYHKTDTPTVAQIFGADAQAFYRSAFIIAEMGFDGVDINMGCPDHAVARKGGGAALILTPKLAQQIIKNVKQAVKEWSEGKTIQEAGVHENIIQGIKTFKAQQNIKSERRLLPVSVKTRIGYDKIVTTDWISTLLEVEPANISLHGRTLKQMYTGFSNWEEIGKAAEIIKKTNTFILGNGDIKSLDDALEKIKTYGTHGALIGRAAFGNPWVFKNIEPTLKMRFEVALEQTKKFQELLPEAHFLAMRKHLAWYCKGFEGASEIRAKLVAVNGVEDVEKILAN